MVSNACCGAKEVLTIYYRVTAVKIGASGLQSSLNAFLPRLS